MSLLLVGASPGTLTECSLHSHVCYEVIMNTAAVNMQPISITFFMFVSI